ncbi:DNA-binding transcriptional regulator, IclR family [Amycolatopsis xylanica]|uniref:DNA-binding transcriptional regulator, IclR family n=1 Tax=Amycolatopsis xylanica TaxID=589385 RepID=A0A1H2TKI5_9PSEU|nr:IclR family transcriptional regulator [Amycolatopsis xylanica]SDW44328.1 DNA-binding transcriptional regulator, IclR family [Amycolatopsis xylanica]
MDADARVQSLDRAIALLNAVADTPPGGESAAALGARCGLNRATAWRLLATLEHHGVLERDPETGNFAIGFTVERWASEAGVEGLVRRAHPIVERIAATTGETANLALPRRFGLTYVDEAVPHSVLSARWLGWQAPLHATSTGKAYLAWLPEDEVSTLLSGELKSYTAKTIADRRELRDVLIRVRERGYSVSVGEMEDDLFGVSAPVLGTRGRPLGVVSVWGALSRVGEAELPEFGELVAEAAGQIAAIMNG